MRRRRARLGDRLCPLPRANRSISRTTLGDGRYDHSSWLLHSDPIGSFSVVVLPNSGYRA